MWNQGAGGFGNNMDQGGGYLESPGFGSPQQSQGGRKQYSKTVVPVTVAQIRRSEQQDDAYMIDNIPLHQVTVVGLIRSVTEHASRVEYLVDDTTGEPLQVKQFVDVDDDSDQPRAPALRENTYVRLYGNIRSFEGKHSVVAFKIQPVTDFNELTMHLLEVIHAHLSCTKGAALAASGGGGGVAGYMAGAGSTPAKGGDGGYAGAQGEPMSGLSDIQRQVELLIRNAVEESGINVKQIMGMLRGFPEKMIREAVEFLSNEGHIYSTVDDDTFRSTGGE